MATPTTNPENMLPIMIVLGIMFIGICIAMNLFSRARFKKRTNAFAAARVVNNAQRRSHRGSFGGPGGGQRLDTQVISRTVSPMPGCGGGRGSQQQQTTTQIAKQYEVPCLDSTNSSREQRISIVKN